MATIPEKKTRSKKKSSRLGHDPLDFLEQEEAPDEPGLSVDVATQFEESIKEIDKNKVEVLPDDHSDVDQEIINEAIPGGAFNDNVIGDKEMAQPVDSIQPDQFGILVLPAHFTIYEVADINLQMKAILDTDSRTVDIQGGNVESIDAAALQLLVSFNRQASERGKIIEWQSCSDKIKEVAANLIVKL
ncbi:MAG: STAS domain-containing protein [Gammaproteobacteria bacterium]|nr:STAS domain-containing protein [Gammaproteobacteria bacterium]